MIAALVAGLVIGAAISALICIPHERAERRAWRLRGSGRLGLPAPKPSTDPTAGEVVLWMIDPSRGRK